VRHLRRGANPKCDLALLSQPQHWKNVKLVMAHSNHMKTFVEIQDRLKMEEKRLNMFSSSNMALVAKGNRSEGTRNSQGKHLRKVLTPSQKVGPKGGIVDKQKIKGNGEKNIVQVKCHSYCKKGRYAQTYAKPPKVLLSTNTPKLYVYPHALDANSLSN